MADESQRRRRGRPHDDEEIQRDFRENSPQRFETGNYEPGRARDDRDAATDPSQRPGSAARPARAAPPHDEPRRGDRPTSIVGYDEGRRPRGPFRGVGPKGYRRSVDRIREDVCDALCDADDVDAREIDVHVEGAEVTLEGTVADRHQKRRAEVLAEQIRGVEDVHNHLRIRRTGETPSHRRGAGGSPAANERG